MAYSGSSAAILSNYDEVLKTFYLPAIQKQLNDANVLSAFIDKNSEDVSGKNATIEMHYGRSGGTGARADGGAMPEADYQKYKQAVVPTKYNYGRVTFSGPTIAATRDEKGAYISAIDSEIRGIVEDLRKEVNRQLWGCGYGVLARWADLWDDGTFTDVQHQYRNNAHCGDGFGSTFGGKYLSENGHCVTMLPTDASGITALTLGATDLAVTAISDVASGSVISSATTTLTCTDPTTTEVAGTYLVRVASSASIANGSTAGDGRFEMMGLRGIVTNTNLDDIFCYDESNTGFRAATGPTEDPLQGIDADTNSWFQAQVTVNSGGTRYGAITALTLTRMQEVFDKVEIAAGKDYGPDMIITSYPVRRDFLALCETDRRIVNTMQMEKGFKGLEYNGIPLMVDYDCIDGEMYFLTLKDLAIYQMSDYDWMTKDGAILSRISGYDAYEAVLFRYAELGCKRRNSQGVLCDITKTLA